MILTVSFEDRDYKYKIPLGKLLTILKSDLTEEQIIDAVREYLKK